MTLILVCQFDCSAGFQFRHTVEIIPEYGLWWSLGIDGISLLLLLLTTGLTPICIFTCLFLPKKSKELIIHILLIELLLIISFTTMNLFFFFVAFESILIPMSIIIGVWGNRDRKIKATYYFFLYTLFGSFFLLLGLLYIYNKIGSLEYEVILATSFSRAEQLVLFFLFFIPFAIKMPMFPFHIWLPEAHVEAPTAGSMLLAGLLLKLGAYGLIRYTIPFFPEAAIYFSPFITLLASVSIIYASLIAMRQSDLKRAIAYSSIAHMNFVVLGFFSFTVTGMMGAIFLLITHGTISPTLFYCVNVLYERHHTRSLKDFSGLFMVMPFYAFFFLIAVMANMGFPGTSSFNAEFLVLLGVFQNNAFTGFLIGIGIILSAVYSIWMYNRIFFGTLKYEKETVAYYADINRNEFYILFTLLVPILILGLNPSLITTFIQLPVATILEIIDLKK